jgi:hypothetical protein
LDATINIKSPEFQQLSARQSMPPPHCWTEAQLLRNCRSLRFC